MADTKFLKEKKTSPVMPAQDRLLKLKREMKDSRKMDKTNKTSSAIRCSIEDYGNMDKSNKTTSAMRSSIEGNLYGKDDKNYKKRIKVKRLDQHAKTAGEKVNMESFKLRQLSPKNDFHGKNSKINNINNVKSNEASKTPLGKKRSSTSIPDTSPCKRSAPSQKPDENSTSSSSASYITSKIRKFIGKIPKFLSTNQADKNISKNKSEKKSQFETRENKINSLKKSVSSSSVSSTSEIYLTKKPVLRTALEKIPNCPSDSVQVLKKKSPPKTETGKKNLFKRKENFPLPDVKSPPDTKDTFSKEENSSSLDSVAFKKTRSSLTTGKLHPPLRGEIKFGKINDEKYKNISMRNHTSEFGNQFVPSDDTETNNNLDEDEVMEWEPTKEDILRNTRDEIYVGDDYEMIDCQKRIFEINKNKEGEKCVYFVVDTNVLIKSLNLIIKLSLNKIRGFVVIVVIPWQVLKELDKLKNVRDVSLANSARRASKFLSQFENEVHNIIFQKQKQHFEDCPQVLVEVPDDHLIKCCCQLKNDNKSVVLLSNDNNLRVKASATGSFLSVPDTWISDLIMQEFLPSRLSTHCFENEPKESLDDVEIKCAQFLHQITKHLLRFLFDLISDSYKKKYDELYELWLPSVKMPLKEIFSNCQNLSIHRSYKEHLDNVWDFYLKKNSYIGIKAIEIEKHARNCISLAKSVHHLLPEISSQFDEDMGFVKTGILNETTYGYTSASCMIAQTFFKRMEDKLNSSLEYLNQLIFKISSQSVTIPDTKPILNNIDKSINVTNEASTTFLLMGKDEEVPLDSPVIKIFHQILLNYLEINQDLSSLPLFSPEDIAVYINREWSSLNPAAVLWLSDVRRRFAEYKSVLREY